MHNVLKNKKVIFFDIGYTLIKPVSGDWSLTNKFKELTKHKLSKFSSEEITEAIRFGGKYMEANHLCLTTDKQIEQFIKFYSMVNDKLNLDLSLKEIELIAIDRSTNENIYVPYDDAIKVVSELSKNYTLGVISDTWPDITKALKAFGLYDYFSFLTYSCELGVFKPNEKMFLDALNKAQVKPEETVFIDDLLRNLVAAKDKGITPILIAANPASDVETEFTKIHSLSELIK